MKINDLVNDNFIIHKTMYDNQVTVLNEKQIPLTQIQVAEALVQHFFDTHILSSPFLTCIFPVERFSC